MKGNSNKPYIKKTNIYFNNFTSIHKDKNKEKKEKNKLNSKKYLLKSSYSNQTIKLNKGQIPLFSKDKKVILIIENKYENKFQKGKSPFFISDKINIREIFKIPFMNNKVKIKHLGLCDYYKKYKELILKNDNESNLSSGDSKTPRFNKD